MFYVVLLAMVAGFLALRLYSVLGKRTGHEQQPLPRTAEERPVAAPATRTIDLVPEPREVASRNIDRRPRRGCVILSRVSPALTSRSFSKARRQRIG